MYSLVLDSVGDGVGEVDGLLFGHECALGEFNENTPGVLGVAAHTHSESLAIAIKG